MTSAERNKKIEVYNEIKFVFNTMFVKKMFGNKEYYLSDSGTPFIVSMFPGEPALVIEYADDDHDAIVGRLEDGDRFYYDDYSEISDLIAEMNKEING